LQNENELACIFKQFISLDKEIELAKEELLSRNDFNLVDSFRIFDLDGKGKLGAN
jgi:hypothetical protein